MNELQNIAEAIEKEAYRKYEALKAQSSTYGELEKKILKEDDSWNRDKSRAEQVTSSSIFTVMHELYNAEIKALPIEGSKR